MKFSLINRRKDGEYNGIDLVDISKLYWDADRNFLGNETNDHEHSSSITPSDISSVNSTDVIEAALDACLYLTCARHRLYGYYRLSNAVANQVRPSFPTSKMNL